MTFHIKIDYKRTVPVNDAVKSEITNMATVRKFEILSGKINNVYRTCI